MLHIELFFLRL